MNIKVYTKENCGQCLMTKKWFERQNMEFEELFVDVRQDTDTLQFLRDNNHASFPVVVLNNDMNQSWSGFRLDKLRELNS